MRLFLKKKKNFHKNNDKISGQQSDCITRKNTADPLRDTNFNLLPTAIYTCQSQKAKAVMGLLEETIGPLPGRPGCVLVLCRWNEARNRAWRLGSATNL